MSILLALALVALVGGDERETLVRACGECHAGEEPAGGFALDDLEFAEDEALWWRVAERVEDRSMPPLGGRQLVATERAELLDWLEREHPAPALGAPPPPPIRRYNRTELRNVVRDLFGATFELDALLVDEVGDGFDTHAGALSWSELALERWIEVVELLAHDAVRPRELLEHARRAIPSDAWDTNGSMAEVRSDTIVMNTTSTVSATIQLGASARYAVEVAAYGTQGGDELPKLVVLVDDEVVGEFDVHETESLQACRVELELTAGTHRVGVRFPNDFWNGVDDRNLRVRRVTVAGPLDEPILTRFQARFVGPEVTKPLDAVRAFLPVVWRRPVGAREAKELLALTRPSDALEVRVRTALVAALASPRFTLLGLGADEHPEHALAERLAAFLWKGLPDERLLALADEGALAVNLAAEVERMLDDARASAFAADFAGQWLQLGALADVAPDARRFPNFDEELARSMRRESEYFVEAVLRERRPVADLLLADFSFVDARLAEHYGLAGVDASDGAFRRVRLGSERRAGVLGHAGVLTVTSNPTRTSPVLRGKWILEALLDEPPPPPPPDAANLAAVGADDAPATLRARLEAHREDAACAACHAALDPLGFALEEFDAVGRWRRSDGGLAIDARGELPDGRAFEGLRQLAETLAADERFVAAVARRLAVYALGRSLVREDRAWLAALVAELDGPRATLRDLVKGVVLSPAFAPVDPTPIR